MSQSSTVAETATVTFGAENLILVSRVYRTHKKIVDAASGYDNLDDAIAALTEAHGKLESQIEDGAGYTPAQELGFGSDNAGQIAEKILGRQKTVGAVRKAFSDLGKVST